CILIWPGELVAHDKNRSIELVESFPLHGEYLRSDSISAELLHRLEAWPTTRPTSQWKAPEEQ
ncbi:MAG: hypothetical protein ACKPKO_18795, partial [Candidatus Fonsibacter sp.]